MQDYALTQEKALRFKKLLSDLTVKLIEIRPEAIESEIEKGLRFAGELYELERIILAELQDGDEGIKVIHTYNTSGVLLLPSADDDLLWLEKKIRLSEGASPEGLSPDSENEFFILHEGVHPGFALLRRADSSHYGFFFSLPARDRILDHEQMDDLCFLGKMIISASVRRKMAENAVADTMKLKEASERIGELLEFEHLLSEISATYINLPTDRIEKVIRKDLGRLGRTLKVDRCILYTVSDSGGSFRIELPFIWWAEEDEALTQEHVRLLQSDPGFFYDHFEYQFHQWRNGKIVQFTHLDELPPEAEKMKHLYYFFGVKSGLSIPMLVGGSAAGVLMLSTTRTHRAWPEDLMSRLRLFGEVFVNAMVRKRSEEKLQKAFSEIKQLKEQIEADYLYLREETKLENDFRDIVGQSDALKKILIKVKQVAPTNATVLLLGETGTGKGLIARAIHNASKRKDRPLIQVNCAALTPSLIESELFGHEKGAFTGAQATRVGRFELARGTTLFLDEIGDLPMELQAKLLRVIQEGEFERVGGTHTLKTDARMIAATSRNLEKEAEEGRFRRDLWYRLNIFPIIVPPLRERTEDIPLFVRFFVDKYGKWIGKKFDTIHQKTIDAFQSYSWPGNIRELENLIERAVITSPEGSLQIEFPIRHD